jgi:hypothetical protein
MDNNTANLIKVSGKVADWFESQAKRNDESIKTCRFETLTVAYIADAKNYRAMAKDLRKAIEGVEK